MLSRILPALALAALAAVAGAQTSIGPFTGTDSDGFETQPVGCTACVVTRVFADQADLCTPSGAGACIGASFTSTCTAVPNTGAQLYGTERGFSEITFDTPVARFGAYWAVTNPEENARAIFYDCFDVLIGFGDLTIPADCSWNWNGWEADPGLAFGRIEIISNDGGSGGGLLQIDDMEADFTATCGEPGLKQCFGDGVDNSCPCGNDNDGSGPRGPLAGCANSFTTGGCNFSGTGSSSVSADDLVLCFTGAIPGQPGIVFCATNRIAVPFGDGIRCCGGNVVRIEIVVPDASGSGCSTDDIAFETGAVPGDAHCYQYWYRDPNGPCSSTFNLSNAYKVLWTP